ncbi:MAG TPA: Holliday junction resolvase RuvX [Patescibacteria group bacterium]|jgi:putative Holliday junction resolvase|nr:Holliday junction resolvase RuvX [Patescibacteria group bacterium]
MKILGIDYGTKRVGLAISDETQTLARELAILSPKEFWQQVKELVENESIERVVIGLPLNMSGESTASTEAAQEFSDELQKRFPELPIEFMDERLSSVMAESMGRKTDVDSLAAQIILQNYLDKAKQ